MLSIYFFFLLSAPSMYASSRVDEIYQKTNAAIQATRLMQLPMHEDYLHLQEFLQSSQAQTWINEVYTLSPDEKVELYKKIGDIWGGDYTYIGRRNHLAALVLTHQDDAGGIKLIDTQTGWLDGSFLGKSVIHDDLAGIRFAVSLQSRIRNCDNGLILESIKSARAAELLLSLPQLQQLTADERVKILQRSAFPNVSPGVWDVFKKHGFDLHARDQDEDTLLHRLAFWVDRHPPLEWEIKFLALRHAGLNPLLKNRRGETALDRIKSNLTIHSHHATLLRAQRLLQEWEHEVRHNAPPEYSS